VSRLTLSFIAAILLVLATAGAALAKCTPGSTEEQCQGVVANLDMTGTLGAGTATEVGFWIHEGGEPVRVTSVNLVFARVADGTVLRFEALPSGTEGRYAAQVELPAGGSWTMALEGHEPLWSMGDDTPTPGRARLDRPAVDHLRQAFAQVTNPAIDPERERVVMDLRVELGRRPALLGGPLVDAASVAPWVVWTPRRASPDHRLRHGGHLGGLEDLRPADCYQPQSARPVMAASRSYSFLTTA